MSCLRCGMCCLPYAIRLEKNDDAGRWLIYHGLTVEAVDEELMAIKGSSKCHMLVFNPDGTTGCGCYQTRPDICRNYLCARAKEE